MLIQGFCDVIYVLCVVRTVRDLGVFADQAACFISVYFSDQTLYFNKKLEVKVKTIVLLHAISICNGFIEVLTKVISEMISETLEQLLGVHKVKCIFKIIFEHYVPLLLGCN